MRTLNDALIQLQCELVAERNRKNPQNISWLQYDILYQLLLEENQLPSTISTKLGISRTKLSKALKELKLMGYLQQKPSQKDGRELLTSITAKGNSLMQTIEVGHQQLTSLASRLFTEEEQSQFTQLATKFSEALKAERVEAHD